MNKLPRSVQEIADVIGRERALFLVGQLPRFKRRDAGHPEWSGGEQVILYVPRTLKPDHQLVRILGWHDADRLVRAFGGELLKPGTCSTVYRPFRDGAILRMLADGLPPSMVASWFGVSERHVKNLWMENPQEARMAAANDNRAHPSVNTESAA